MWDAILAAVLVTSAALLAYLKVLERRAQRELDDLERRAEALRRRDLLRSALIQPPPKPAPAPEPDPLEAGAMRAYLEALRDE